MTGKQLEFMIDDPDAGTRLDRCLSRLIPGQSRSYLQKLIREGLVFCNGERIDVPRYPVSGGMKICVHLPECEAPAAVEAEEFHFPILYEDDAMLIIDKPSGVVVHPAAGNPDGTVVNALLSRYPELAERLTPENPRPGIVHRLDKDTSGCLVIAKTPEAQFKLGTSFAGHEVHKTYLALIRGIPRKKSDEISGLIGRHAVNRKKMAVVERNGKLAVTRYRVKLSGLIGKTPVSLVEVDILTGRTHQIRVHMASIGHAVLGDDLYGGAVPEIPAPRQMLHAWRIVLPHPVSRETIEITSPLPEDFLAVRNLIQR